MNTISYTSMKALDEIEPLFFVGPSGPAGSGEGYVLFLSTGSDRFVCSIKESADVSDFESTIKSTSIIVDSKEDALSNIIEYERSKQSSYTTDASGKPLSTSTPNAIGMRTWIHPRGDDGTSRGEGTELKIEFIGSETGDDLKKAVELEFCEPVEIASGKAIVASGSWSWDDFVCVELRIPATSVSSDAPEGESKNCILVDCPGGHAIIPATSGATHYVDLDEASPILDMRKSDGHWEVDYWSGQVSVGLFPGHSRCKLFDFPITLRPLRMRIGTRTEIDANTKGAEWVHHKSKIAFIVKRSSPGAGVIYFEPVTYRENIL